MTRLLAPAALAFLTLTAAGCGLRGDLERPQPAGAATPAPRAGEGEAEGQDSRTDQQDSPVATVPQPNQDGAVPSISRAPLDGTNDPVGRPPNTTASGPR